MYADEETMDAEQIMSALMDIRSRFSDADTFPTRHYGGPGPIIDVRVERDDHNSQYEIVFHTRSW